MGAGVHISFLAKVFAALAERELSVDLSERACGAAPLAIACAVWRSSWHNGRVGLVAVAVGLQSCLVIGAFKSFALAAEWARVDAWPFAWRIDGDEVFHVRR